MPPCSTRQVEVPQQHAWCSRLPLREPVLVHLQDGLLDGRSEPGPVGAEGQSGHGRSRRPPCPSRDSVSHGLVVAGIADAPFAVPLLAVQKLADPATAPSSTPANRRNRRFPVDGWCRRVSASVAARASTGSGGAVDHRARRAGAGCARAGGPRCQRRPARPPRTPHPEGRTSPSGGGR